MRTSILESQATYGELTAKLGSGSDPIAFVTAGCAERVRAQLCFLGPDEEPNPVHTNRLIRLLRDSVEGLKRWLSNVRLEEASYETLCSLISPNDVITRLADAGDIIGLGHGWWLPAPSRLIIPQPEASGALIVSGLCSPLLLPTDQAQIAHIGIGRYLQQPSPSLLPLPCQDLESWLGIKNEWSPSWSREFIRSCFISTGSSGAELPPENLEVFMPDQALHKGNRSNWLLVNLLQDLPSGPVLCRRALETHMQKMWQYSLVLFGRSGRDIMVRRVIDVGESSAARLALLYAAEMGLPYRITMGERAGYLYVRILCRLPMPERRLLALGWRTSLAHRGEWKFPPQLKSYLVYVLERLKCTVVHLNLRDDNVS